MKTTPQSRSALRALEAKATRGEWQAADGPGVVLYPPTPEEYARSKSIQADSGSRYGLVPHGVLFIDDAQFIVAARNSLVPLLDDLDAQETALAARDRRIESLEKVLRQARGVLSDMIKAEDERNEAASQCVDEGLIDRDCADDCPQDDTCRCPGTMLIGKAINRRNFHEGDCVRAIDRALATPPTKEGKDE